MQETPKLWTRDFTIITPGSAVSILGNCIAGFAAGLPVPDYTGSTLLRPGDAGGGVGLRRRASRHRHYDRRQRAGEKYLQSQRIIF